MTAQEMERQLEANLQQLIVQEQALAAQLKRVKADRLRQEGALMAVRQLLANGGNGATQ